MADAINFGAFTTEDARFAAIASAAATGAVVKSGWIPPDDRTPEQDRIHEAAVATMPTFGVRGRFELDRRRYALWQAARTVLGKDVPYIYQQTGSCVGAGGGNMMMIAQCVEIALKRDPEEFKWPWWTFTYGCSRVRGGLNGQGEGSFGSAYAKAATLDGYFELDPAGEPDLPDPAIRDGWASLPSDVEMKWSDGNRIATNWKTLGRKHLFKTAAPITSADAAVEALANGYPITCASMFGFSPMVPPAVGTPAVRLVRSWNGQWAHQMSVDEYWDHPTLGEIFGFRNQWGSTAHGTPVSGEPTGGFYVTKSLFDQIIRSGDAEVYAFSAFDGFPARKLDFSAF